MRHSQNENGFTLIDSVMGMAVVSILFLALSGMTVMNFRAQKNYAIRSDVEELVTTIRGIVNQETSCTQAIVGVAYDGSVVIRDPLTTQIVAQVTPTFANGWRIDYLAFENVQPTISGTGMLKGTLVMDAVKDPKISFGPPAYRRQIADLYFSVATTTGTGNGNSNANSNANGNGNADGSGNGNGYGFGNGNANGLGNGNGNAYGTDGILNSAGPDGGSGSADGSASANAAPSTFTTTIFHCYGVFPSGSSQASN